MRLKLGFTATTLLLFTAIFLKCLSPFLHTHSTASTESGFHISGVVLPGSFPQIDVDSPVEEEPYAFTVSDSRGNSLSIAIFFSIALTFFYLRQIANLIARFFPYQLPIRALYLSPNSPPPSLAPPF